MMKIVFARYESVGIVHVGEALCIKSQNVGKVVEFKRSRVGDMLKKDLICYNIWYNPIIPSCR